MEEATGFRNVALLETAYTAVVADALDRLGFRNQALDPGVVPQHPAASVAGRAVPVRVELPQFVSECPYEGDMRMMEALQPGDVPVLIAPDGNRAALWGELFSCAARERGAKGAIVSGYVRDTRQVAELGFPVFARGRSPLDTMGRAEAVEFGIELICGDVLIAPGDYVIADEDGVVFIPKRAIQDVLEYVGSKARKEGEARSDLMRGESIRAVWNKHGVL
jgi:4-hydroxy-4-methyl-2-oxoglutarate aldolase